MLSIHRTNKKGGNKIMTKLESNYKNIDGKILSNGDIVQFYYDADYGYYFESNGDNKKDFTEMIDVVWFDGTNWFLVSDCGRAAYIWRHNEQCKTIGNVWDNDEFLKTFPKDWIEDEFTSDKILESEFLEKNK